jgi:hypothetical protein
MSLSHLFNETWLKSSEIHSIICSIKRDVTKSTVLRKYTSELEGRRTDMKRKRKVKETRVEHTNYMSPC